MAMYINCHLPHGHLPPRTHTPGHLPPGHLPPGHLPQEHIPPITYPLVTYPLDTDSLYSYSITVWQCISTLNMYTFSPCKNNCQEPVHVNHYRSTVATAQDIPSPNVRAPFLIVVILCAFNLNFSLISVWVRPTMASAMSVTRGTNT